MDNEPIGTSRPPVRKYYFTKEEWHVVARSTMTNRVTDVMILDKIFGDSVWVEKDGKKVPPSIDSLQEEEEFWRKQREEM